MKKNNQKLDVVFLLDRSGSMRGSEEDTIGGYNNYLNEQKGKNALITTVLFDNYYEILHFRKDINEVNELTKKEYFVRGSTSLYDAIGKTITKLDNEKLNNKVLFVITTDGLENSSKEYNKNQITELIKGHTNWEFIYLGANIDSYEEGTKLGISKKNISNYSKSKEGINNVFKSMSMISECLMEDREFDTSWKNNLEEK